MTPGTVTHQAPVSMGFSRQEYRGGIPGLPCPPLGGSHPGVQPSTPLSPALAVGLWEASPKCARENERVTKGAAAASPSERLGSKGCDGPGRERREPRCSTGRGGGTVPRPPNPWGEAMCGPGFWLQGLCVCLPRVFSPKERPCRL